MQKHVPPRLITETARTNRRVINLLSGCGLDELNKQLTVAESDRIQKEAIYRLTQNQSPEVVSAATVPGIERLRSTEADTKTQLAELSAQFGPAYPKVREANGKLAAIEEQIASELRKATERAENDYQAALGREKLLRASLEEQKRQANKLNESAIQYSILKREVETNRQLYESLLERLKEAGVAAGLKSSNTRIVDPARVPLGPVSPAPASRRRNPSRAPRRTTSFSGC